MRNGMKEEVYRLGLGGLEGWGCDGHWFLHGLGGGWRVADRLIPQVDG